ncbi:MAG: GreA/GreB family elongation factor [Candidatus Nomurabacteria bacterium]|jgi:transcription elongation GreA/GreB family factor|nr:GreA/GreB family elongation factor [Candidatus Nomurabacteria bacterium]
MEKKVKQMLPFELEDAKKLLDHYADRQSDLSKEMGNAMSQNSETWHDNAVAEAVMQDSIVLADMAERAIDIVTSATLVDIEKGNSDTITMGCVVELEYIDDGLEQKVLLTGNTAGEIPDDVVEDNDDLADAIAITTSSPLGGAINGKTIEEEASFAVPSGDIKTVKIISIKYLEFL